MRTSSGSRRNSRKFRDKAAVYFLRRDFRISAAVRGLQYSQAVRRPAHHGNCNRLYYADQQSGGCKRRGVTTLHIFGLPVDLIGFQGGIIVALLIGIVTAKLDIFFEKKVPEVIRLLVSPLLTTLVSSFLLFMVIGPVGRGLANGITAVLVWMTQHLGVIGYAAFSGVQQLIVITGLHHVFGAIESQLLVDTGRNFLNPLMSVAIIAQGGAVLGYILTYMYQRGRV